MADPGWQGDQQRKHQSGFSTPELNQRSGKAEDMEKRATQPIPTRVKRLIALTTLLPSLTHTNTGAFAHHNAHADHRHLATLFRPHPKTV